jgi:leucyl aminopeptidase
MLPIQISLRPFLEHEASCYAAIIDQGSLDTVLNKHFMTVECDFIKAVAQEKKFVGNVGQILSVPMMWNKKLTTVVLVGIGKKSERSPIDIEKFRRAIGTIIRVAEDSKFSTVAIVLPNGDLFEASPYVVAEQAAIIVEMAGYHFDEFITAPERKIVTPREVILVAGATVDQQKAEQAIEKAKVIAASVNKARHWIDLPPMKLSPGVLSSHAQKIADETGLKVTIFAEKEIAQMGMGGLAGVSKGSELDCQLVILEYKTSKAGAPTIGFVGKGITFDSGGLSLKPAAYMETMKEDMSGAAAVISAMQAIAILKPEVNVVGIAPIAENLPSGTAIKPGDILTFYNGKTAEVKNTDAEGRLILADALSYAVKHCALDAVIDIATLTGACAYALGPFFSGLMSQHRDLIERIQIAAITSGDRVWELPLHDDYKIAIKSQVADICNIGSKNYNAGAITAAFFLQQFVENVPWAHLDIAGTAFNVPDVSYYRPEGATGVAVRLIIELAMNWHK